MSEVLIHHGVKGQKWGVRRYQNRDGSRTKVGQARLRKSYSPKDSVFISGKVKYDRPLDEPLKKEVDKIIKSGSKILIGDAPGADTRVQDYLASKGYSNVVVYTTDKKVRNNVGNWKVQRIGSNGHTDEKSIRQQKDIAMTRASTRGLAIMPIDDRPDSAMSLNVQRMNDQGTPVLTYDYERGVWHSAILCHHGIKGQKWGVRRYQNSDGSLSREGYEHYAMKNVNRSRSANLDKWGKTKDTNVLYIAGYSGSGKSTTAIGLARNKDKIIHLDGYTEDTHDIELQNKAFNKFLDKNVPNWKNMTNASNRSDKGYWKIVDQFRKAIEDFGASEYKKGNRCIVEGVQIADRWLSLDYSYYKNKPVIALSTNPVLSMHRAFERDGRGRIIKGLVNLDRGAEFVKWYIDTNKNLKELSKVQ